MGKCQCAPDVAWASPYETDEKGLYLVEQRGGGETRFKLASHLCVLGQGRDERNSSWSLIVGFKDPDGRAKTVVVDKSRLMAEPAIIRAQLAKQGFRLSARRKDGEHLIAALASVETSQRVKLVEKTGWASNNIFVLPNAIIDPCGETGILYVGESQVESYRRSGSLEGWRQEVGALALGNDLILFAIGCAFSGPLLRNSGVDGGGFHFRGPSSSGKTTLAMVAASVWTGGGSLGGAKSWRATDNGIEGEASAHSETLLVLDELGQVAPDIASTVAYSLANGQAKARARIDGSLRSRTEWSVLFVSTGEIGLAEHLRSARKSEIMPGQEVRFVDIAADLGSGMGAFQNLHGYHHPSEFSDALKAACRNNFGVAGPAFVEALIKRGDYADDLRARMSQFRTRVLHDSDTGQVRRVAERFGLVAAAGELASLAGVLDLPDGASMAAAEHLFHRWAEVFGRSEVREELHLIRRLRKELETQRIRFPELKRGSHELGEDVPDDPSIAGTLGFRKGSGFEEIFFFLPSAWAQIVAPFSPQDAARILLKRDLLEKGDGSHLTRRPSAGMQRLYAVKARIFEIPI